MDITSIIAEIDAEIYQLQQAKKILADTSSGGRSVGNAKITGFAGSKSVKRVMSTESRSNIAKAQKARWAKARKAAKKAA